MRMEFELVRKVDGLEKLWSFFKNFYLTRKACLRHMLEQLSYLQKGPSPLTWQRQMASSLCGGALRSLLGMCDCQDIIIIVIGRHRDDVSPRVPNFI